MLVGLEVGDVAVLGQVETLDGEASVAMPELLSPSRTVDTHGRGSPW